MDTINIGGEEREVRLLNVYKPLFARRYNQILMLKAKDFKIEHGRELLPTDNIIIPQDYFFWVIWKCLVKKGKWPLKKPFRSLAKMIREIEYDEVDDIVSFVSHRVLGRPEEGKESGN